MLTDPAGRIEFGESVVALGAKAITRVARYGDGFVRRDVLAESFVVASLAFFAIGAPSSGAKDSSLRFPLRSTSLAIVTLSSEEVEVGGRIACISMGM